MKYEPQGPKLRPKRKENKVNMATPIFLTIPIVPSF